jgi:hypothetical protein
MAQNRPRKHMTPDALLRDLLKEQRYHQLGTATEGGTAQVASCYDAYLNRIVAVKQLKDEAGKNEDLVRAFVNEVKLIGYLDHPGVVSIFDTFVMRDNRLSYSMKFIEGYNLEAGLEEKRGPDGPALSVAECVGLLSKLAETLAYVHDRGVIHLDLKPASIMLGTYGQVLIMDWGSARLYDERPFMEYVRAFAGKADVPSFQHESEDMLLGTPAYMSPEQTSGPRNALTPVSDIFSTGIILYQILTGNHPFAAGDPEGFMQNIRRLRQPPAHEVNPDVPRRVAAVCQKMLEKDPLDRYPSFHEVLDDLHEIAETGLAFFPRSYEPGQVIVKEGEAGDFAFTIASGRVRVTATVDGRQKELGELGKGEMFGEHAILKNRRRTETVTALEPTTIRVMTRPDVEMELEKLSPWVGAMVSGLYRGFNDLDEKLRALAGRRGEDGGTLLERA